MGFLDAGLKFLGLDGGDKESETKKNEIITKISTAINYEINNINKSYLEKRNKMISDQNITLSASIKDQYTTSCNSSTNAQQNVSVGNCPGATIKVSQKFKNTMKCISDQSGKADIDQNVMVKLYQQMQQSYSEKLSSDTEFMADLFMSTKVDNEQSSDAVSDMIETFLDKAESAIGKFSPGGVVEKIFGAAKDKSQEEVNQVVNEVTKDYKIAISTTIDNSSKLDNEIQNLISNNVISTVDTGCTAKVLSDNFVKQNVVCANSANANIDTTQDVSTSIDFFSKCSKISTVEQGVESMNFSSLFDTTDKDLELKASLEAKIKELIDVKNSQTEEGFGDLLDSLFKIIAVIGVVILVLGIIYMITSNKNKQNPMHQAYTFDQEYY